MNQRLEHRSAPTHYLMADWLAESERRGTSAQVTALYPPETLHARAPAILKGGHEFFPAFHEMETPPIWVTVLAGGHLCADEGGSAVLAPDGTLIWDVSYGHEARVEEHWYFTAELPPAERHTEALAVLTLRPGWSDYYFHWMFEVLPRIHLLRLSGAEVDRYALHPLRSAFQYETLATLGVHTEKLLELTHPMHLVASELVVPSMLQSVMPRWACEFLRRTFLRDALSGNERLYISRANARGRRVVNEAEVEEVLSAHGFRTVELEGMSVHDQARLFATAALVVSPHGGGLTNIVFCNPGAKVVEFFAREYVQPLYWMLSNRRELDYYCLVSEGDGPESWMWWPPDGGVEPIEVDIDALNETVTAALTG
jgi:Glycosyltransferase 61